MASYIGIVREVRPLATTIFLLRAVAGMIPAGGSIINPAVNAIQTMIAQKAGEQFRVALFQNTPAAFHNRPNLVQQLTAELQHAFEEQKPNEKNYKP
ncbi:MAG: SgcJ/EcaC family oxidoreductase [Ferruginibacter sp.]|nr:SgcJ/EcaC family oxidoreductase [Ferruginibacter sp.]